MKNMLMGYLHAPSAKKIEAFSVIGKFLDFSKDELASVSSDYIFNSNIFIRITIFMHFQFNSHF